MVAGLEQDDVEEECGIDVDDDECGMDDDEGVEEEWCRCDDSSEPLGSILSLSQPLSCLIQVTIETNSKLFKYEIYFEKLIIVFII